MPSAPSVVLRSGLRIVLGGAFAVGPEAAAPPSHAQYYIHPDHLGTPRLVTDVNQTIVWRWDSTPFGESAPNEDPDGDGHAVVLNLRFPGQYYDQETGLSYNYFRDYDASTGRYVESDPIGLRGGLNTYVYVDSDVFRHVDPGGTTACDADAAISAVQETFPYLNADPVWIWWDFDWGGLVDSPVRAETGIFIPVIRVETEYRPCLNWGEALGLLGIMMHEILHYNDSLSDQINDWRNPRHTEHYIQASRMTRLAVEAFRRIRGNCQYCCTECNFD